MNKSVLILVAISSLFAMQSCTNDGNSKKEIKEESSEFKPSEIMDKNTESFKEMDAQTINELNQKIINEGLVQLEEILGAYAPKSPEVEGNYQYNYTIKDLDSETKEITLTETGIMDDSLEGRKVIMVLLMGENNWKVASIKESYKCWTGRGHESWSSEPCN